MRKVILVLLFVFGVSANTFCQEKINIDDLITHVMPIEKINDAFDLMHKGESIRSVVTF